MHDTSEETGEAYKLPIVARVCVCVVKGDPEPADLRALPLTPPPTSATLRTLDRTPLGCHD